MRLLALLFKFLPRLIILIFTDLNQLLRALYRYTREAEKRVYVKRKYNLEKGLKFVNIDDLLPNLEEDLTHITYLDGSSRLTDIALLRALCRQYEDCDYLEIGSWRGESLVNTASIAASCTSISLSAEDIYKMGRGDRRSADMHRMFSGNLPNVEHIEHNSLTFDFTTLKKKFDVIFVDGDHSYHAVNSDTSNVFNLLKNEHSIIVWHDCGFGYEGQRYEVLAGILDGCPEDFRHQLYRVTNTLCAIHTKRQLTSKHLDTPQYPDKTFSLSIKSVAPST